MTTRCLPSHHVYSVSLGPSLFIYSSHFADGDWERFHQDLGPFFTPLFCLTSKTNSCKWCKKKNDVDFHFTMSVKQDVSALDESKELFEPLMKTALWVLQYKPFQLGDCAWNSRGHFFGSVFACWLVHAVLCYLHQRFFQATSQGPNYFTQCTESLAQEILHGGNMKSMAMSCREKH